MPVSFLIVGINAVYHHFYIDAAFIQVVRAEINFRGIIMKLPVDRGEKVGDFKIKIAVSLINLPGGSV